VGALANKGLQGDVTVLLQTKMESRLQQDSIEGREGLIFADRPHKLTAALAQL